jgi:hypothetical protein
MEAVVKDTIEIRGRVASDYGAPGLVVVFDLPRLAEEPRRGDVVVLLRPDGWLRSMRAGETQEHGGAGRSLFLEGISKDQVPIGTRITWGSAAAKLLLDQPAA